MARYQKITSTYIARTHHQNFTNGTIWERNWVTIGERHRLEPGKRSVYGNYNFLFTDNTNRTYRKRQNCGRWVAHLMYGDVADATPQVNESTVSWESDDIRSYAYYGSALELVEKSVVNIINEFPGNITVSNDLLMLPNEYGGLTPTDMYWLSNPFDIDLYHEDIDHFPSTANIMRFMSLSWQNYELITLDDNGAIIRRDNIASYIINKTDENLVDYHDENWDYILYDGTFYKWNEETGEYEPIVFNDCDNYFVRCDEYIRYLDRYYEWDVQRGEYIEVNIHEVCPRDYENLYIIDIETDNTSSSGTPNTSSSSGTSYGVTLYGYRVGSNILFATRDRNFIIQPLNDVIEDYFDGLTAFEKQLLTRKTNPLYRNSFVTPVETDEGFVMQKQKYIWPSNGYCIDVSSPAYSIYLTSLIEMARNMDNFNSNNIIERMTHESIKNFDWSYRRVYDDGDEVDNIEGGQRMEDILLIYGRIYDDIKRYIDGIYFTSRITYDNFNNLCNAEISDKNELRGWEIYSTIWQPYYYREINSDEIPEDVNITTYNELPRNINGNSPEYVEIDCTNPTYYIRTVESPNEQYLDDEYLYGYYGENLPWVTKVDPWIITNSQGFAYRLIGTSIEFDSACNDVNVPGYWDEHNTFTYLPPVVTEDSPEYIRVYNNTVGFWYYQKITYFDNTPYLHDRWYGATNKNYITPIVNDIEFNRRLFLSTYKIWNTKGTKHGIDMVMAMFGFGREDDEIMGDYTLTEEYFTFVPRRYDEVIYHYVQLYGDDITCVYTGPTGVVWDDHNTFEAKPVYPTANDEQYPIYIRVGSDEYGYSYYEKVHEELSQMIERLTSHKHSFDPYEQNMFMGIPMSDAYIGEDKYIIPFYSDNKEYDGNIYFQMKGGWAKRSTDINYKYDYTETWSYLRSVSNINELLGLSPFDLENGDLIYVVSLIDLPSYNDSVPDNLSHYFKVIDSTMPNEFSSWRMIPLSGDIIYSNYVPLDENVTHEDYLHAKYLDDIISLNIGNNPHTGYGNYDMGREYIDYMQLPYKYAIENNMFDTFSDADDARYVSFPHEEVASNDKVKIIIPNGSLIQYTNSKVLYMHNNLDNAYFKQFFNDVILNYLLQVIPSTTILILDGFMDTDEKEGRFCHIEVEHEPDDWGMAYQSGDYALCSTITITAIPFEGYAFSHWTNSNDETISNLPTYRVRVTGDETYTAHFIKACKVDTGFVGGRCDDGEIELVRDDSLYAVIPPVEYTITYTSTQALPESNWITNNTNTSKNTYNTRTHKGVLYLNDNVTTIGGGSNIDSSPFYLNENITSVDLSESGLTIIDGYAFRGCSNLLNVIFSTTLTKINYYAFYGCSGITELNIPEGVTEISYSVFRNCSSLRRVTLPSSITSISVNTFVDCNALESVYFLGNIEQWCRITFGHSGGNPLQFAHNLYIDNELVTDLAIPESITEIKTQTFYNATCLTSVAIPNTVTDIGENAFLDCSGITGTLIIPDSVTNIANGAFCYCTGIEEVIIGNSVVNIGSNAFTGNVYTGSNLSLLTIGSNVQTIGEQAFGSCNNLLNVTCLAATPPTLEAGNFEVEGDKLYVPSASVNTYKNRTSWRNAFGTNNILPIQ